MLRFYLALCALVFLTGAAVSQEAPSDALASSAAVASGDDSQLNSADFYGTASKDDDPRDWLSQSVQDFAPASEPSDQDDGPFMTPSGASLSSLHLELRDN